MREGRTTSTPGQPWHDDLKALAVSPDGRTVATADDGDDEDELSMLIRLWDVKTGAQLHSLTGTNGDLSEFRFTPAGGLVGVSARKGAYEARDMLSGKSATWQAAGDTTARQDVSADGRFVVTGAGLVGEVWDAQTGARLARVEGEARLRREGRRGRVDVRRLHAARHRHLLP